MKTKLSPYIRNLLLALVLMTFMSCLDMAHGDIVVVAKVGTNHRMVKNTETNEKYLQQLIYDYETKTFKWVRARD